MRFGVRYYDLPLCTVNCTNCTFSGGGYTNASFGTVYQCTYIKVTAGGSGMGSWSGLKSTDVVSSHTIRFTVHRSGTIAWTPQ